MIIVTDLNPKKHLFFVDFSYKKHTNRTNKNKHTLIINKFSKEAENYKKKIFTPKKKAITPLYYRFNQNHLLNGKRFLFFSEI